MTEELMTQIEEETGFVAFESPSMAGPQYTFYGTSDKWSEFKTLIGTFAKTGSIAYLMDTGESYMYSKFKNTWY